MGNNFTGTAAAAASTTAPGLPVALLRVAAELAAGGRDKIPSGAALDTILADAIERLCGHCPWTWLDGTTTLSLTADQAYVTLPGDFGQFVSVEGTADNRYCFRPTVLSELLALRATEVPITPSGDGQVWWYAMSTAAQTGPTVPPRFRLELYPTPSQTEAGAVTLAYRRRVTLPAAADGDAAVVAVPPAANPALLACVRLAAAAATLDGSKPAAARYQAYQQQAAEQLAALVRQDGGAQTNLGSMIPGRLPLPRAFEGYPVTIQS